MALVWLLQIAEPLPIDGDVRLLRTGLIAEELLAQGHEVVLFSGRFDHSAKKQRPGDKIHLCTPKYRIVLLRGPGYRSNLSPRRILYQILTAIDFLRSTRSLPKPDRILVSYPSPELAFVGAVYAKLKQVPYVVDYRDAWPESFIEYVPPLKKLFLLPLMTFYKLLRQFCLRDAQRVYVTSVEMGSLVNRALIACGSTSRSMLCHLAYKRPNLADRTKSHYPAEPIRVIFVGALGRSYNIDRLIAIAKKLDVLAPEKFHFAIVGDGECRQELEAKAKSCTSISFLGWLSRSRLDYELAHADVGALFIQGGTALYTVPNKFAEYLAYGLPVISDLRGEVAQLITKADAGYTIENDENAGAERWLLSVMKSPLQLQRFKRNAALLFDSSFDSAHVYGEYARNLVLGLAPEPGVLKQAEYPVEKQLLP